MKEGPATLVRREQYAPPAFWIRSVDLTFDLDPAKTLVINRMRVERNAAAPADSLRLHGEGLNLSRVLANGASVSFRHEGEELVIDNLPEGAFDLEIRNTCAPEKNTQLSGLYTSSTGFFTQCEAEGFRRITYFLDRPDVMAVYTVTLRADKARYPVLLSNGNLVEAGELEPGPQGPRHFAKWHDPFPKPSYLFAVVAANLVAREQRIRTRSGTEHLLQIWVRKGDLDKTEHAMASLVASVAWDEARFGLPLDLERFMIVAVADFNMGAMENKGLNIFNTRFVSASAATSTDAEFADVESVIGHEYFHNWTGNRITCRDWFQLSLKEGLTVFRDQEFSMDMAHSASARAAQRIEAVRNLREMQFSEDAGPMAHPVRPDAYEAIDNFYTATVYEKGAEVVRMMQTLVGRSGFRAGMDLYFARHDGQAVTCDDFAQAIADANPNTALAQHLSAFKRWYGQAGTPQVRAAGRFDAAAGSYTLTLSQQPGKAVDPATQQPFVIPVTVGLLDRGGALLALHLQGDAAPSHESAATERVLVLHESEQSFVFTGLQDAPVPSLLRRFSAPVVLTDDLTGADLLLLLQHDSDPFNRWEASQRLALSRLIGAVQDAQPLLLDAAFVDGLRALLRDAELDPALKALALQLPSEAVVAEHLSVVDPAAIHSAREAMRLQLAQALRNDWQWAFETQQPKGGYRPDGPAAGQRALANLALSYLCLDATERAEPAWPGRAYQRVKDASNMTDRQGALVALIHAHAELAKPALEHFFAAFADEDLVIDKWLALQATAPERDGQVFARAKQLVRHPSFSLQKPNRVRSLLLALARNNPAAFHRTDAAGYVFWSEKLIELDALNPNMAARLARALDRWAVLAEPYRSAAQAALERVAARTELSSATREIIQRALGSASA